MQCRLGRFSTFCFIQAITVVSFCFTSKSIRALQVQFHNAMAWVNTSLPRPLFYGHAYVIVLQTHYVHLVENGRTMIVWYYTIVLGTSQCSSSTSSGTFRFHNITTPAFHLYAVSQQLYIDKLCHGLLDAGIGSTKAIRNEMSTV